MGLMLKIPWFLADELPPNHGTPGPPIARKAPPTAQGHLRLTSQLP